MYLFIAEKRLSLALAPTRQTRGIHDYYDHDDELGFPSLEGALMSISFLTFAVYLVRLVMVRIIVNNFVHHVSEKKNIP